MKKIQFTVFAILFSLVAFAQNSNPYEIFGHNTTVKYESKTSDLLCVLNKDTKSEIKAMAFDMEQSTVSLLGWNDTLIQKLNIEPDQLLRWFSVDPLEKKYPHATPYNFVENNPISRIDPDGADWILSTGNKVYWYGGKTGDKGNLLTVYKATSGYKGPDTKGKMWDLQNSQFQNVRDGGPTAEGKYHINLKPDPNRTAKADLNTGALEKNPLGGIEKIPSFVSNPHHTGYGWSYSDWGEHRAALVPDIVTGATNKERDNNSYYLHDSQKGYSHGCTEVEGSLFNKLSEYRDNGNQKIDVIVDYPNSNHNTNGGTLKIKKP